MKPFLRSFLLPLLILTLGQCKSPYTPDPTTIPTWDDNMALGNPDGAKVSESSPNTCLITHPTYSLSYNNSAGIANCRAAGAV